MADLNSVKTATPQTNSALTGKANLPLDSSGAIPESNPANLSGSSLDLNQIQNQVNDIRGKVATLTPQVQDYVQSQKPLVATDFNNAPSTNFNNAYQAATTALPPEASKAINQTISTTNNLQNQFSQPNKAEQNFESVYSEMLNEYQNAPSKQEMTQQLYEQYGIPNDIQTVNQLNSSALSVRAELDKITQQESDEIYAIQNRPGVDIGGTRAMTTSIQNKYAKQKSDLTASLNSYLLQAQIAQGNLVNAQNYADKIVAASTYDSEQKYKMLVDLKSSAMDWYKVLDSNEKAVYDNQLKAFQDQYQQQKDERKQIVSWATSPNTAAALIGKDLSTISFDDAAAAVQDYVSQKVLSEPAPTTPTDKIDTTIASQINSAVDQYKLNPTGFRENFVDSLTSEFGEPYRDYISQQVYALMPDLPGQTTETLTPQQQLDQDRSVFQQYKDAGYSRQDVENQWLTDNKQTSIPSPVQQILDDIYGKKSWW
jgi:hypothetical protein